MNDSNTIPGFSATQSKALKKKMHALRWKPESVMRETVLIQRLRELTLVAN